MDIAEQGAEAERAATGTGDVADVLQRVREAVARTREAIASTQELLGDAADPATGP